MAFEAARLFSSPVLKICISSAATDANAQAARFYGLFLWPDAEAEGTKATLNPFAFLGLLWLGIWTEILSLRHLGALDDLLDLHIPIECHP